MRILDVRTSDEAADIQKGRGTLLAEISHPSKTVMIIRGNNPEISRFADAAAGRAAPFPWREVVWVKNSKIFEIGQETQLFGSDASNCAVILNLEDKPTAFLPADSSLLDIEEAFLDTGGSR